MDYKERLYFFLVLGILMSKGCGTIAHHRASADQKYLDDFLHVVFYIEADRKETLHL